MQHWTTETDNDGIVWLRLDKANSSANVLSTEVMMELNEIADGLQAQPPRGLVLFSGKHNGFIMGADINEFTSVDTPERAYEVTRLGQQLFDKIENLPCPTVVALTASRWAVAWNSPWRWTIASRFPTRSASSGCQRSNSVYIPVLAAQCGPCRSAASARACS